MEMGLENPHIKLKKNFKKETLANETFRVFLSDTNNLYTITKFKVIISI